MNEKFPVIHFEIGCKNLEKTTAFYKNLFGWSPTITPYAAMLQTGTDEGIQGHITALGHEPHQYVTFYIKTKNIQQTLDQILKEGGQRVIGPVKLPDGNQFAWFKDLEGNMLGLITG